MLFTQPEPLAYKRRYGELYMWLKYWVSLISNYSRNMPKWLLRSEKRLPQIAALELLGDGGFGLVVPHAFDGYDPLQCIV